MLQNDFASQDKGVFLTCLCQERRMMQMHPYILNVNEDAQLSGVVKLFIQEGTCISSLRPQGFYLLSGLSLM